MPKLIMPPQPNATVKIELITPEVAREYKERNNHNRPFKPSVSEKYTHDMQNDLFEFNGESIIFGDKGNLLDGQHRLESVIESDTAHWFVVVRGIPEKAFDTIDLGRNRSVSDIMKIMGKTGGGDFGATARIAMAFENGMALKGGGRVLITQKDVVEYIYSHPYMEEIIQKVTHAKGRFTVSPLASVLFLANRSRQYDKHVDTFLEAFKTGENMARGNPIYTLREWVMSQRTLGRGHIARDVAFPVVARVWSDFMKGKQLSVIKISQILVSQVEIFGYKEGDRIKNTPLARMKVSTEKPITEKSKPPVKRTANDIFST